MRCFARFVPFAMALALLPVLFGCTGTVVPPAEKPAPVSARVVVSIAENSVSLGAGETHQFTAIVTGNSNTAVTWSLSGCTGTACGTLSPTGLYTAPSTIPVETTAKVSATSQADSTKFDSVDIQHMPVVVSIRPFGAWVLPGKAISFTTSLRYDTNNAGVAWSLLPACSNSTCGTLSSVSNNSVSYTAPATVPNPSTVKLTATSITDPSKTADVTITVSNSNGLTEGDYAFKFDGWEIHYSQGQQYYTTSSVATAGHFHADSNGNITAGVEDINLHSGISQSVPFAGTYGLGPDGRGSLTITTAEGTSTYRMTVNTSGNRGQFIKIDDLPADTPIFGSGFFEMQDNTAFTLSSLAGSYAIGMLGTVNGPNRTAALGTFSLGPDGTFTDGKMDMTVQIHVGVESQANTTSLLTGSFGAPSPTTGRGAVTLTASAPPSGTGGNLNFIYYVISDEKILMVQTDSGSSTMPRLSGELRRQKGPFSASSLNAAAIFSMTGANRREYAPPVVDVLVGQVVPDGVNSLRGVLDDNQVASNKGFSGSYTVTSDGRSRMTLELDSASPRTAIAYLYGQNEGFVMDTSGTDVWFGGFKPQLGGPFSLASVCETFLTATTAPPSEYTENVTGVTSFDGAGGITSTLDASQWADPNLYDVRGTYTIAGNGRGTLTFTSPTSAGPMVFWTISPTELVGIAGPHPNAASVNAPIFAADLLDFEK